MTKLACGLGVVALLSIALTGCGEPPVHTSVPRPAAGLYAVDCAETARSIEDSVVDALDRMSLGDSSPADLRDAAAGVADTIVRSWVTTTIRLSPDGGGVFVEPMRSRSGDVATFGSWSTHGRQFLLKFDMDHPRNNGWTSRRRLDGEGNIVETRPGFLRAQVVSEDKMLLNWSYVRLGSQDAALQKTGLDLPPNRIELPVRIVLVRSAEPWTMREQR